jgi:hypothetical protein
MLGVGTLNYLPFGEAAIGTPNNTLRIGASDGLFCLPLQATGLPRLSQTDAEFSMAQCRSTPPEDLVFRGGFEDTEINFPGGSTSGADLMVDMRLETAPTEFMTDPMRYEIYVRNCSSTETASNVRVRDFFPVNRSNVNQANGLLQDSPGTNLTCLVDGAPAAQCTPETKLDPVNGSALPYLVVAIGDLGPGQLARVGVTRIAEPPMSGLPMIRMNAAVVSDVTNEPFYDNNSGSWDVSFLNTNNLQPTLAINGAAASLTEDDDATDIGGITITAVDADGSISNVSVNWSDPGVANATIRPDPNPLNFDQYILRLTPAADANGMVSVNIVATDNLGGTDTDSVDVMITPVNDAPSITVKGGFDYNDGNPMFNGPSCDDTSGIACASQSYPATVGAFNSASFPAFGDWVISVSPGPANEAGQASALNVTTNLLVDPNPSMFLGSSFEPNLIDQGGTWDLNYGLSGRSGTATIVVTVDDGESINNTSSLTFNILVDNSAPTVNSGQVLAVNENTMPGTSVGTVAGNDPDAGDMLQDWTIVAGNVGFDGDGDAPFAMNAGTGEITVNDMGDMDFESQQQFTLDITVSDGAATSAIESVTINILNVDEAAVAVTDMATAVMDVTATVNGTVTANDLTPAVVSFEYGLTNSYGTVVAAGTQTGSDPVAVSADLTGLACNTEYHYRVTVTNTLSTIDGDDGTFTTSACVFAQISDLNETAVTDSTATVQGLVDPNGSDTTVIIRYGIGFSLISTIGTTPGTILTGDGPTQVSADLVGLTCGTTYRFVIEASNNGGTTDGGLIRAFNTAACP